MKRRGWIRLGEGAEFDRIRAFADAVGAADGFEGVVPPGDDAVAFRVPAGSSIVVGTDVAVEDVHFRRAWLRWEAVGFRATAAALSDIAAMGAEATGVLITLVLPPELDTPVYESIGAGVGECLRLTGAALLGGDIAQSPGPVVIDVVAIGCAERPVSRRGARPGEELWVTGSLGAAATAVADWRASLEPDPRARRAFERPSPRLREARWLIDNLEVTAMIDLSDGLAGDAGHIAAASRVALEVDTSTVPLADLLAAYSNRDLALRRALSGGEDYELLLTATAGTEPGRVEEFERRFGLALTRIGRVSEGRGTRWLSADGELLELDLHGYDHFTPAS
jgi:thiamine-monophosphate kinase